MIYDAFTYYNEIDLLRVRLIEHASFVDRFVIVEGDRRFTGAVKESRLDLSDPRIREFRDRIILVRVPLDPIPASAWDNEIVQRNATLTGIEYKDEDMVLVSDVDELVSRYHWPSLLAQAVNADIVPIRMCSFNYFINLLTPEIFTRQKLVRVGVARRDGRTTHELRMTDYGTPAEIHGWHFSFLGDVEFIRNKINSFAHQEYNNLTYNSDESVTVALKTGTDLFGRFGKLTWVRVTDRWPTAMRADSKWAKFVAPAPSVIDWLAGRCGGRRRRLP